MLRILALLLMAVEIPQFTVSVESRPTFTVSVSQDVTPAKPPEKKAKRRYLAMFTAHWCGPCQEWKRTVLPKLEAAGYVVRQFEMTDREMMRLYGKKISSCPSFAVIDYETGEWLSDVTVGKISMDTAVRMLGGSVERKQNTVVRSAVAPPVRFIEWPGWGTIDLETYSRDCNCAMCVDIRGRQQEYWRQLKAFQQSQASVTPDQEGCPHDVVENMLDQMQLRSDDVVGDLGCGDGRVLISAARRGLRGIGIEIDPARADIARRNVESAGFGHLVTIETGDALDFDASRITVATAYLYPPLLAKLAPKLHGLRVVASPFHEVPGLQMTRAGDVWFYRAQHGQGESNGKIMAYNAVGDIRGNRASAGAGTDAAR